MIRGTNEAAKGPRPGASGKQFLLACILLAAALEAPPQQGDSPKLTGPYLGQRPPGDTPAIFAPGIVSTKADEYALEVSASGKEILFVRDDGIMLATRDGDGTWNGPALAPFSGKHVDGEPCFSPDGRKIYFISRRPLTGSRFPSNLWVSEKTGRGWSAARPVAGLVHDRELHAPSVAADGSIYEDGIIRFPHAGVGYRPGQKLAAVDGYLPYIYPDESRIICAKRPPGKRDYDLFVSFRRPDGTWAPGLSLGDKVNSSDNEGNSFVTADGRYLFFSRRFDIFWVSAEVIENLREMSSGSLDSKKDRAVAK